MYVWNYIDDIFACADKARADAVFRRLYQLIEELGLPINPEKVVEPTDIMTCMGIEVDAKRKVVSLTKEKLHEMRDLYDSFAGKNRVTRRLLQSLLGKLLYLANIVIPARAFLNRMLWYLRSQQGKLLTWGNIFIRI